ncbi:serine hydrolase FSH [Scleroderma citrinum]
MSQPRKILMLHGNILSRYSQNASIFSKRLGALRKALDKDIELVFLDGPIVLQPIDLDGDSSNASLSALGASEAAVTSSDPTLVPRAWWKANPERTVARGLEESLVVLRDVLQRDRYDGVFGFSQGAAMAALLAALLEKPETYPPFLIDGNPPHPRFQFCVAVSGFKVSDPISNKIFGDSYETPTLHVIGNTDVVVVEERSRALLKVSTNARVEEHAGGHFVPSQTRWRSFWREYLRNPNGDQGPRLTLEASTPVTVNRL